MQKHPTPYRSIKSHKRPAKTIQKQLQLSRTGNNLLELAITIMQHLNQKETRKINSQVRLGVRTTV